MPDKETIQRARTAKREGKRPSTQAGEFVREEIHHVREGKHGARSTKQAIAIGLSKARRAGVKLPPKGRPGSIARKRSLAESRAGRRGRTPARRRSRGALRALKRAPRSTVSRKALARQARRSARRRGPAARKAAARKAAETRKATTRRAA